MKRDGVFDKHFITREDQKSRKVPDSRFLNGTSMDGEVLLGGSSIDAAVEATEDIVLRQLLDDFNVKWERVVVDLEAIDFTSNIRQTREEVLDLEYVDRYSDAIKQGAVFPEMLLYKSNAVCGRHRGVSYMRCGIRYVWALVVTGGTSLDEKLDVISAKDNQRHGKAESTAAYLELVANRIISENGGNSGGFPDRAFVSTKCDVFGIAKRHRSEVYKHIRSLLFKAECIARGWPIPEQISTRDSCYELLRVNRGDELCEMICRNSKKPGIAAIAADVKKKKLAGESALDYVKDQLGGFAGPRKRSISGVFGSFVKALRVAIKDDANAIPGSDYVSSLRKEWEKISATVEREVFRK